MDMEQTCGMADNDEIFDHRNERKDRKIVEKQKILDRISTLPIRSANSVSNYE